MAARNRPRSGFVRDDNADESGLWLSIVDKIRKCRDLSVRFEETQAAIDVARLKVDDGDATPETVAALEEVEKLHREGIKAAEEELRILQEDPDDLLKNLDTLISVRSAFESEPLRIQPNGKSRNMKRRLDTDAPSTDSLVATPQDVGTPTAASRIISKTASRSGSVAAASTKSEDRLEPVDGRYSPTQIPESTTFNPRTPICSTATAPSAEADQLVERDPLPFAHEMPYDAVRATPMQRRITRHAGQRPPVTYSTQHESHRLMSRLHQAVPGYKDRFSVGSDVFYKTKKNQEGEGILCKIISVVGEGKSRKYEIQDSDPEPESANEPAWKVSAAHLVPIPPTSNGLAPLPKNKQVLAVYPQTTTFYKAEMVGSRSKDMTCRLRFEGEDDGATEQEVERRFVLDLR